MRGLRTAGVVVSLLVLGAHFLRAGHPWLVLALLLAPLLLLVRRTWAIRCLQVVLLLGALEWLRTLVALASVRLQAGEPVLRMGLILSVVAAVAVLSAIGLSRFVSSAEGAGAADDDETS